MALLMTEMKAETRTNREEMTARLEDKIAANKWKVVFLRENIRTSQGEMRHRLPDGCPPRQDGN
jgi:hypothetical protein